MKILVIQARYHLKKDARSEFYRRFRDNNITEMTSSEDGNLDYQLYFPMDSDTDICFIEKWRDEKTELQHHGTLHYAILQELKMLFVKKVEIHKFWAEEIEEQNITLR